MKKFIPGGLTLAASTAMFAVANKITIQQSVRATSERSDRCNSHSDKQNVGGGRPERHNRISVERAGHCGSSPPDGGRGVGGGTGV